MHVNHRYLLDFIVKTHSNAPRGRFLDYGCGTAQIVVAGRKQGLDIYGVEVFYEGGDSRQSVTNQHLLGDIVREIHNDRIDFPDAYFDIVVSNQVLEHVADLDHVLTEIRRVLKPDGMVLSLFPAKNTWREGHCGIPFLHWFPKGSRTRLYYAYLLRCLGFGYHKQSKTKMQWARDFCQWLDAYTHYRSRHEIDGLFKRVFSANQPIEYDYVAYRLAQAGAPTIMQKLLLMRVFQSAAAALFRKTGGLVIQSLK